MQMYICFSVWTVFVVDRWRIDYSMLNRLDLIFALFSVDLCTFGFHSDRV